MHFSARSRPELNAQDSKPTFNTHDSTRRCLACPALGRPKVRLPHDQHIGETVPLPLLCGVNSVREIGRHVVA